MGHTYTSLLFHCVFSTKARRLYLTDEIRQRVWPYMGGIARDNNMHAIEIGGTDDHVHTLLSLPSTMAVAKGLQLIKAGSSKWVSVTFTDARDFAWQEGVGAFSVSISHKKPTIEYVRGQEKHHRTKTFKEEFVEFLKTHEVEYDERYIWD